VLEWVSNTTTFKGHFVAPHAMQQLTDVSKRAYPTSAFKRISRMGFFGLNANYLKWD
jgi:hypothetical protein